MSRPTNWCVVVAAFALLVVAAAAVLWYSAEPAVDGKPVSYWISKLGTSGSGSEAALDKIGLEKAMPYLLSAIGGKEHPEAFWYRFYRRHYDDIPTFVRQSLPVPRAAQTPDKLEFIQSRAGYYLARVGDKHPSLAGVAVPQLIPLLENTNRNTRFSAGIALTGFGSNAAPAIAAIEELLKNDPEKIHDVMLIVLEKCGPAAKPTIPTLQKCAERAEGHLSIQCARTLWLLDSSQADLVRPVAKKLSVAQDTGIRIESASLLWKIDKDPAPVVPVLIGLLKEERNPYDYRTILLLKQIGPGAKDAIPALNELLNRTKRREEFFFKAAAEALEAMGADTKAPTSSP